MTVIWPLEARQICEKYENHTQAGGVCLALEGPWQVTASGVIVFPSAD